MTPTPVAPPHAGRRHPTDLGERLANPRVLLVDDSKVSQILTAEMLKAHGCEVVLAEDGESALELVKENRFALIMMDCVLPGMDGLETTRRIRQWESTRPAAESPALPIVALSGDDGDGSSQRAAGMNECLTKPVSLDALGATLRRWLADISLASDDEKAAGANAAAASAASVIDRKALDQIRALQRPGAPNLVAQIVESYLAHAASLMENLAAAVLAGNAATVKELAHSFKSSSANVGALALAGRCKALEFLARAGTLSGAAAIQAAIEQEFVLARDVLSQILKENRS